MGRRSSGSWVEKMLVSCRGLAVNLIGVGGQSGLWAGPSALTELDLVLGVEFSV